MFETGKMVNLYTDPRGFGKDEPTCLVCHEEIPLRPGYAPLCGKHEDHRSEHPNFMNECGATFSPSPDITLYFRLFAHGDPDTQEFTSFFLKMRKSVNNMGLHNQQPEPMRVVDAFFSPEESAVEYANRFLEVYQRGEYCKTCFFPDGHPSCSCGDGGDGDPAPQRDLTEEERYLPAPLLEAVDQADNKRQNALILTYDTKETLEVVRAIQALPKPAGSRRHPLLIADIFCIEGWVERYLIPELLGTAISLEPVDVIYSGLLKLEHVKGYQGVYVNPFAHAKYPLVVERLRELISKNEPEIPEVETLGVIWFMDVEGEADDSLMDHIRKGVMKYKVNRGVSPSVVEVNRTRLLFDEDFFIEAPIPDGLTIVESNSVLQTHLHFS